MEENHGAGSGRLARQGSFPHTRLKPEEESKFSKRRINRKQKARRTEYVSRTFTCSHGMIKAKRGRGRSLA